MELKRVDDFVKLLVGLVVGQFLRDAHLIRDGLRGLMLSDGSLLAEAFPYLFVALVIRNVHAAFRYDSWCAARHFSPTYESHVIGRACSFGAGVLALFVSTYAVEHVLAVHLVDEKSLRAGQQLADTIQIPVLTVFLLLPFTVYFLWDLALWVETDGPRLRKDKVMQRFVKKWLAIDICGLGWLLICLAYYALRGQGPDGGLTLTLIAFSMLAAGTVLADYFQNVSFYFKKID